MVVNYCKISLFVLLLSNPFFGFTGPSIFGTNIKVGFTRDNFQNYVPSFGIAKDFGVRHPKKNYLHRAFGINCSPRSRYFDVGLQGKISPNKYLDELHLTKSFSFYLVGSINYRDTYGVSKGLLYKPGLVY